jgi:outer membrane protein OmpA-like peptidoglycan-associated protein
MWEMRLLCAMPIIGLALASPAADATTLPGPFLVQFESGSAALTPTAEKILENVASIAEQVSTKTIILVGHADRVGMPDLNLQLSCRRAAAVRDYLKKEGISAQIKVEGVGEDQTMIETADEVAELRNRSVFIFLDYTFLNYAERPCSSA